MSALEKIAYVVTFFRPGSTMQTIEYRRSDEPYWSECKERMAKRFKWDYQKYCISCGYISYSEGFYTQDEVDNLLHSYDTGHVSKRMLGIESDDLLDFSDD
jgi:hypothetical protein